MAPATTRYSTQRAPLPAPLYPPHGMYMYRGPTDSRMLLRDHENVITPSFFTTTACQLTNIE